VKGGAKPVLILVVVGESSLNLTRSFFWCHKVMCYTKMISLLGQRFPWDQKWFCFPFAIPCFFAVNLFRSPKWKQIDWKLLVDQTWFWQSGRMYRWMGLKAVLRDCLYRWHSSVGWMLAFCPKGLRFESLCLLMIH
jgi:hypothetical protein